MRPYCYESSTLAIRPHFSGRRVSVRQVIHRRVLVMWTVAEHQRASANCSLSYVVAVDAFSSRKAQRPDSQATRWLEPKDHSLNRDSRIFGGQGLHAQIGIMSNNKRVCFLSC